MKENLDDVLNAHSDAVRIERLTHHIARICDGMDEMRRGQEEMRVSMKQRAECIWVYVHISCQIIRARNGN